MKNLKVFTLRATLVLTVLVGISTTAMAQSKPSPLDWQNATNVNGKIWSDILPKEYANCISKKGDNGEPIVKDGWVECEKDENDNLLNASRDDKDVYVPGLTIIEKSDATEACKKIGGVLPSIEDFIALGSGYASLPMNGRSFWSASAASKYSFF